MRLDASAQQPPPCQRSQGRRHQQRVPAGCGVLIQHVAQERGHVGVGGMHLVDAEQQAQHWTGSELGVPHAEARP